MKWGALLLVFVIFIVILRLMLVAPDSPTTQDPPDTAPFTPLEFSPRCIVTYPQLQGIIDQASLDYNVPRELIAAIITSESSWDDNSHRFEPGFQLEYIQDNPDWRASSYWVTEGPTIQEWFYMHPDRAGEGESMTQQELGYIAQTRISSSYGLMQVLYPSSIPFCDFNHHPPEELYDITVSVQCGTKALSDLIEEYDGDYVEAVSAYNAGASSWRTLPRNRYYTEKVIGLYSAFLECPN